MIDSNLPSLPTFLGKTKKTDYFQMLLSLQRFLGRSGLKSIDSKLWLGRLPSLPIFEGKSPPVLPTILGRYNFLQTNAKKAKIKSANICWLCWQIIRCQGHANNAKNWPRTFCKGIKASTLCLNLI